MKEGVEIKKIGTKKLDNTLHVKYHDAMYDFVVEFDLPKLGIPEELKNEWKESIDTERENNLEAQASVNSELLLKKNEERDRLLKYIFGVVRNGLLSPEKEKSDAAMRLNVVMSPYAGIRKESFDRETMHVDGMLIDLKKTENATDVSKLGLSSDITKLETLNKEFDALYSERAKKRADNKLPKTLAVRSRTDAIFERILIVLQYKYVYGTTPVEPELIAKLIARFNERAEDIDASYRQGLSMKKTAAEKRKQNPNAPKEPKKPKEPKPKKPEKDNKDPDIRLPETEGPKKPDQPKKSEGGGTPGGGEKPKQPEAGGGEGGNPDIHLPEE
jgi:hypothetical protein